MSSRMRSHSAVTIENGNRVTAAVTILATAFEKKGVGLRYKVTNAPVTGSNRRSPLISEGSDGPGPAYGSTHRPILPGHH